MSLDETINVLDCERISYIRVCFFLSYRSFFSSETNKNLGRDSRSHFLVAEISFKRVFYIRILLYMYIPTLISLLCYSPDVIFCGWLGSKHQLTNQLFCVPSYAVLVSDWSKFCSSFLNVMWYSIEYCGCRHFSKDGNHSNSFTLLIPQTRGSFGHHRWLHNQFPPFFSVLLCPLGLSEFQACPFSNVVFPSLFLSALSSSSFHCALQNAFGKTW